MRISSYLCSRLLAIGAAIALCGSCLLAQQTLGGITGEVTDASGGVIPNVAVTLVDEQTSLTRCNHDQCNRQLRFCKSPHWDLHAHLLGHGL